MAITHHELCFGCGSANLFGLQIELEPAADGVSGRFFVKQDHQGPPGVAHGGIVTTALDEAMSLAVWASGTRAFTRALEVELHEPAPVGTFVRLVARIEANEGRVLRTSGVASSAEDDRRLAEARGTFVRPSDAEGPRDSR